MVNKYEWNRQFRARIIALCFLSSWYAKYGTSIIKPEYFETETEQAIVSFLNTFYQAYKRPPDLDEIAAEFVHDQDAVELVEQAFELAEDEDELLYAQDRALQFAKEQAMKIAILQSVEDIEHGILSTAVNRVKKALAVGTDLTDLGLDFKNDFSWLLDAELEDNKIPTAIYHLDQALDGGMSKGEYGVVLGSTNVGKTQMLINIGFGALSRVGKQNVVHITLEMSAKKIALRYAARVNNYFFDPTQDTYDSYIQDFHYMSHLRTYGDLRIKQYPTRYATIHDIDNYLDRLEAIGWHTDVLIVDYPDIMRHENVGEYRHNISHTSEQLRRMAVERNILIWGASQANRSALNKELVDLDNIAEDYGKVQIADVVLAVSQTKVEYEAGMLRVFGAKVRDGKKHWVVVCEQDNVAHSILSRELKSVVSKKEEQDDMSEQKRKLLALKKQEK